MVAIYILSLVALPLVSAQSSITRCPTTETTYTATDGSQWALCPASDYQGPSAAVTQGVASFAACTQLCQQYKAATCTRAVWNQERSECHVKSSDTSQLKWVADNRWQSSRFVSKGSAVNRGVWTAPAKLPVIPAGAFIVPEQPVSYRILGYSSWGVYEFGGPTGKTQFTDYNWQTGAVSQREVANTKHDMFCPGMSILSDGRMIVSGGSDSEAVSAYDYRTNSWTRMSDMKVARGYQSSVTTSRGEVFTIGGSFTGGIGNQDVPYKNGEIYNPTNNVWTSLPGADVRPMLTTYDAESAWRTDNHFWGFGWKNSYVFQAGPSKNMNWYSTTGTGSTTSAGTRDSANDAMCGVSVMYDAVNGKILTAGGSQSYTNSPGFTRAHSITINQPGAAAQVEQLRPMNFQRGFANAVVLPSGEVVVTGGQAKSLVFTDIDSVYNAELYNPNTKTWTILAAAQIPRNYHAVALLLADGRVWAAGSGLCAVGQGQSTANCDQSVQHFDGEILTPPYLLQSNGQPATRPSISSLSSDINSQGYVVRVGGKLTVGLTNGSTAPTFSLVRLGSATHSVNTDQRRVPLTQVVKNGSTYTLTLPNDSGIVIPGYYYLFAMNSAGVPAIARTVQVTL